MTDSVVKVAIQGDTKGLQTAVKGGEKALDSLGKNAKEAAAATGVLGKEVDGAERVVSKLGQTSDRAGTQVGRLGRAAEALKTSGRAMAWGSEKIVNQYTAIAGGVGLGLAVKKQIDYQAQLTQMMINARDAMTGKVDGKSFAASYADMDGEIRKTAIASGVSMTDIAAGIQRVIDASGDFGLAKGHLKDFAETAVATSADFSDVAMLSNALVHTANLDPSKLRDFLNVLVVQGKAGALTMKDYATEGPRMFTVMSQFGKLDLNGLYEFGAFQQVAMKATADPAMARTAILTMARDVAERKQFLRKMKEYGLYVKDWDKITMTELVKRLIVKAKGDARKVMPMFTGDAQQILLALANDYKANGKFKELDSYTASGRESSAAHKDVIGEDFLKKLGIADTQIKRFAASVQSISSEMLAKPLDRLTSGLEWINEHGSLTRTTLLGIAGALGTMATIVGGMKLAVLVGEFNQILGRGKNGRLGGAGSLGGLAGATPVFVVNMPVGGIGGAGVPGAASEGSVVAEEAVASGAARAGWAARNLPTFSRWISTSKGWLGKTVQELGVWAKGSQYTMERVLGRSAVGRFMMQRGASALESGTGMWRNLTWGSGMGRIGSFLGKGITGSAMGAVLALPFELLSNEDKKRAVVAALGTGIGSTVGGIGAIAETVGTWGLGSLAAPALTIGGGIAGRQGALMLYDWLAKDSAKQQPIVLNLYHQVDSSGVASTRVEGPGAANVDLRSHPLTPAWAP